MRWGSSDGQTGVSGASLECARLVIPSLPERNPAWHGAHHLLWIVSQPYLFYDEKLGDEPPTEPKSK